MPPPPAPNLVANPGFESGLAKWNTGDNRTSLTRTCAVAHGGSCSAQIGRTTSAGEAVLDDSPNTVSSSAAGATYAASAWVKAPAGRTITLRLREYRGSTVVKFRTVVVTATGAWQQVAVSLPPAAGGTSISVDVLVSLTTSLKAQVDDVTLRRA